MTDRIFSILDYFWPFTPLTTQKIWKNEKKKKKKKRQEIHQFTQVYHNKCTIIWYMVPEIWSATDRIFCHFGHFLPFYPTNNQKDQNFENMKKTPGDIILHKCTKNHDYMRYGAWQMYSNCYFSFWVIFCPFTPQRPKKSKIFKKWKKCLEISLFYTSVSKIMIICYTVPEIWRVTDVIVIFHFGLVFAL